MRLINTETLLLENFPDLRRSPPYAILSHTWGRDGDEVTLQEMVPGVLESPIALKPGFDKIRRTCRIALEERGLKYAWVDTCCIDKTSSAELSEAINSMFKWYQQAAVCFAFLEDWEPDQQTFDHCRWWTRGWTLQELVAPRQTVFFDRTWSMRGDLDSLHNEISDVSRIKKEVLTKLRPLSTVPVAVRMSWASRRETSREEDVAYCLMGIFDINMPMLYGEGPKAFLRLQEEIIKTTPDQTLFAWVAAENDTQQYTGILASSPGEFSHCSRIIDSVAWTPNSVDVKTSISNRGIKTNLDLFIDLVAYRPGVPCMRWTPIVLDETLENLGIYLWNVGGSRYIRAFPALLSPSPLLSTSSGV
ncbi:heterokaryon incompatibility protein-domain-containing protein [Podospora conica]|nr:heterokaryon incompatibility protein-domain-containing protein [Schizothecium conicum]